MNATVIPMPPPMASAEAPTRPADASVVPLPSPALALPPIAPTVARSKADWVRSLYSAGWRAFLVRPNDKRPMRAAWQEATEAGTLADLVANPDANIGAMPPPGHFVLDIDAGGADTLAAFELMSGSLPATLEAVTQSGGKHMVFTLSTGETVPNAVRFAPGLDVRASGKGYVVVQPSIVDGRAYLWQNWRTPIAPAPQWLIDAIKSEKPLADESKTLADPDSPIPEGMRNDALASKAGKMRAAGFDMPEIIAALTSMNDRLCLPPLPDNELATIAASVARYPAALEPWQAGFGQSPLPPGAVEIQPAGVEMGTIVGPDDETDVFAPLPHYVDRWIPQDEVTLLAGHGGGGKSYVALSLAACVALGRPFGPLPTRKANVLFYSAEDGARVLRSRRARICRSMGIDPATLAGKLILLDASDIDPALFGKRELPALSSLAALAEKHRAELVVVDNASDAFAGDEIKRAEVRGFIRALRARLARPGRAVLLLAHINKQNANNGRNAGAEDYSGSTAWHNSVRSRLSLSPGGNDAMTIDHMKANHGPKADPVRLEWREGVPVVLTGALVDQGVEADRREEHKRALVGLIQKIEGRGARVPSTQKGSFSTFNTLSADAEFPQDIDKARLIHLMNELQDEGLISRKVVKVDSKTREIFSCTP